MNLLNTEYITLKQLLDSIKGDFRKYAESGIIDESSLYKIVAYTNAIAGIRINPIEYAVVDIENYKTMLPDNFRKVKTIDTISNFKVPSSLGFYKNWTETVSCKPAPDVPLYTPMGCINDCGQCYWTIPYKQAPDQFLVFTDYNHLYQTDTRCNSKDQFKINRDESIIEFGVKSGKALVTYYVDMDAIGLIPKQPQLYFFYEWSLKVKILQDILMNTEDDVIQKLQYAEKEKMRAYIDFDNYVKGMSFKKSKQFQKEQEESFYSKWFLPFY